MTFKEYFNSLKIPLKETSTNFCIIFIAIAEVFDSLGIYCLNVVFKYFIQSTTDTIMYAQDRNIFKIKNESNSSYFHRVKNAYSFNKKSSTLEGIYHILKSAINKPFTIRELYLDNWILGEEPLGFILKENEKYYTTILGADYTSYYFVVSFDTPLTLDEKIYLEELIEIYKPAHIGYHLDAKIVDNWKLDNTELLGITTYIE